jgi:histidine triad (HIT) family protein
MKTFEDIVSGKTHCRRVWEDERHLAFLSSRPVRPGHTIVIPKKLTSYLFDMPLAEYRALWDASHAVAELLRERLPCERVCVAVVGWEVRHVHVHLVPTNASGEFPPLAGVDVGEEELDRVAARLGAAAGSRESG